ncbi:MAG: HAD-IC family P-type ATPase, partial [Myxococcota bacterium]
HEQAAAMGAQGLRVLAFARKEMPADKGTVEHEDVGSGLELLGLQGMIDPPRPEAIHAIEACRQAGVDVKMITGDHPATARAIAERLGMGATASRLRVMSGPQLAATTDEALLEQVDETDVFARVSPEHKLRLVEALQAKGHVVAMTGDGVNDAPALRRANIGVAMGLSGTEVAREASDMILTDDNFATIEAAIEEGRGVFDNLVKFIAWTLPTNGGEASTIMVAIVLGLTLPVLPVQILWINMTTAVCLGMMLAFEPKEAGIMRRPPRAPGSDILTAPILLRVALVSALLAMGAFGIYEWELAAGASDIEARTAAVAVFVFGEMFYLFNCRSLDRSMFALGLFSNPWIWAGAGVQTLLQLGFTYLPFMNELFHTTPLRPEAWIGIVGVSLGIYLVVGFEKWVRRAVGRMAHAAPSTP